MTTFCFKLPFSFLLVLLFPIFSFCQERVTEYIGEGTNTAFYNTEHDENLYLIRVTQCDEIEVLEVESKDSYRELHSITIPDVFGAGYHNVRFLNEFMCFPSHEGLVAYNFIDNSFTVTPIPDPWRYSLFRRDNNNYKIYVTLKLSDQSEFSQGIYDVAKGQFELLDESYLSNPFRNNYFIRKENTNNLYTYYLYDYIKESSDTIVKDVRNFWDIQWENDNSLIYINEEGILETYNIQEQLYTQYNSVKTDIERNFNFYAGKDYLILYSNDTTEVYDSESKELVGRKYFEIDNLEYLSQFEIHGNTIIAYLKDHLTAISQTAIRTYFWNLETDKVVHFDASTSIDKAYYIPDDKSLLKMRPSSAGKYALGIVNHNDLSLDTLEGAFYNIYTLESVLYQKDGNFFLNYRHRHNDGINTLIEIDTVQRVARSFEFDKTTNGFPAGTFLRQLSNANVLFTSGSSYPQKLFNLSNQLVTLVDSTDISSYTLQNDKFYYYSEDNMTLNSYDGTKEEIYIQDYYRNFSDYKNVILFQDWRKLYALDKSNNTSTLVEDSSLLSDIIKIGKWTYYTIEDGLYRIDSLLEPELISPLTIDIEDKSFIYQDKLHFTHDSTLYKVTSEGQLEVILENGYRFRSNHTAVGPNSSHLLLNTLDGLVHYNGVNFNELGVDFNNAQVINQNVIANYSDLLYFLDEQIITSKPEELKGRSFVKLFYFKAYDVEYIVKTFNLSPYNEVSLYKVNSDLSSIELISLEKESIGHGGGTNFIEFENQSLLFMSGLVYTFSRDAELKRIEGLIAGSSFIVEDEDVYFMAYDKYYGNQVYHWNPDFGSGTAERISLKENQVNFYPNPNGGSFQLSNYTDKTITKIEVINTSGQLVPHELRSNNRIDIYNNLPGLYFVNLTFEDDSVWTGKIVIE